LKTDSHKRLFLGIPIGYEIQPLLNDIQSSMQYNNGKIKWVPYKNIHLTLTFLGNVVLENIPQLIQAIDNKIDFPCFKLSIENTGVFPSINFPKIVWLDIAKGIHDVVMLHKQVEKLVTIFKVHLNIRSFIPHITIGRVTSGDGKIDVLPFIEYVYSPIELYINSVTLYESQLLRQGVEYKVLFKFLLN